MGALAAGCSLSSIYTPLALFCLYLSLAMWVLIVVFHGEERKNCE
jgi:hypothetical protein